MKKNEKLKKRHKNNQKLNIKISLPDNYHENMLDLENQLINNRSLEILEKLMNLYKVYPKFIQVGVEYYSGISITKQEYLSFKLKDLFLDKGRVKLIEQHHRASIRSIIIDPNETCVNPFDSNCEIEPDFDQRDRRSKTFAIKNNVSNKTRTRNPTVTSRLSISINPDIETDNKPSNFENFKLNQSEYKFIEDEEIASKEAINTYFSNVDKFEKILEDNIKNQEFFFYERLKQKKTILSDEKVIFH